MLIIPAYVVLSDLWYNYFIMNRRHLKKSLKIVSRFGVSLFILFFALNIFFTAPAMAVKIDGKWGTANGNTYAYYFALKDAGMCNPGIFQLLDVEFGSTKDKWLWSCVGEDGGATVTDCYAFIEKSEETGYCGDGIVDLAEECDDGNTVFGDGCSVNCEIEKTGTIIGTSTKIIEYSNPLKTDNIIDVVKRVADYFYYVAIAIVPIITIYAAVLFLTAGGNEQQVAKARKTFIWLVIGIAILLIGSGVITLLKDILNVE